MVEIVVRFLINGADGPEFITKYVLHHTGKTKPSVQITLSGLGETHATDLSI